MSVCSIYILGDSQLLPTVFQCLVYQVYSVTLLSFLAQSFEEDPLSKVKELQQQLAKAEDTIRRERQQNQELRRQVSLV